RRPSNRSPRSHMNLGFGKTDSRRSDQTSKAARCGVERAGQIESGACCARNSEITHDLNIANVFLEGTVRMAEFFVVQSGGLRAMLSARSGQVTDDGTERCALGELA